MTREFLNLSANLINAYISYGNYVENKLQVELFCEKKITSMYFEVFCKTKIALTSWMTISRYFEMLSLITKSDILYI